MRGGVSKEEWTILYETLLDLGHTLESIKEFRAANPDSLLMDLVEDNKEEFERLLQKNWMKKFGGQYESN